MFDELGVGRHFTDYENAIHRAALDSFPDEQDIIAERIRELTHYNLKGGMFVVRDPDDNDRLPVESHGLTRKSVDLLSSLLYVNPGPARHLVVESDDVKTRFANVYRDSNSQAIFQTADKYATLLGYSLIQAFPTTNKERPVRLYVWDASQALVFPSEDSAFDIEYVVTMDVVKGRRHFTFWNKDFVAEYESVQSWNYKNPNSSRAMKLISVNKNGFGRLPFGVIHNSPPVSSLTVDGIGQFLADNNEQINQTLYDMALGVKRFLLPKPWVSGVSSTWEPDFSRKGRFIRIPAVANVDGTQSDPKFGFMQAELDVQQSVYYIERQIDRCLESLSIPPTLWRSDLSNVASGIAMEIERKPLIDYTKARQADFAMYEADVAGAVLSVMGYVRDDLSMMELGVNGVGLNMQWPRLDIQNSIDDDQKLIDMGLDSKITVSMRRDGFATEQDAYNHLKEIEEHNALFNPHTISSPAQVTEEVIDNV